MHQKPRVILQDKFSIKDFHCRWKRARTFALQTFLQPLYHDSNFENETELLCLIPAEQQGLALRKVFDNSRKLGLSVSRFLNLSWEIQDISDVLSQSESPCLRGHWKDTKTGKALKRNGCPLPKTLGSFVCDYWREALDGLIMGVGETERYARHASVGHGDKECVDIFYDDSIDVNSQKSKFGEVPENISSELKWLTTFLIRQGVSLNLRGVSEGVLYYEFISHGKPLCGSSNRAIQALLSQEVKTRFPGLALKDASPLAVYGEGT